MAASVAPTIKASEEGKTVEEEQRYGYLVLDSGPIIRRTLTGRTLDSVAEKLVTVPGVWDEIKDAKARQYLQDLLLVHAKTIETREPTKQAMIKVADFAKQTGDYRSLSAVDLSVLALAYELENEGCLGNMGHIRTQPKRTLGVGHIQSLNKNNDGVKETSVSSAENKPSAEGGQSFFETLPEDDAEDEEESSDSESSEDGDDNKNESNAAPVPKTWAMLVNPSEAAAPPKAIQPPQMSNNSIAQQAVTTSFGSMNLLGGSGATAHKTSDNDTGGQFSDAEEDSSDDDDENPYDDEDASISDEECDVYILDPAEVEARKALKEDDVMHMPIAEEESTEAKEDDLDFPSLSTAMLVPYEGSDNEEERKEGVKESIFAGLERKKQQSLQIIAPDQNKDGTIKKYNSFRKHGDLVGPQGVVRSNKRKDEEPKKVDDKNSNVANTSAIDVNEYDPTTSRIMMGEAIGGSEMTAEDDDGEGWVTSSQHIRKLKESAGGTLDPMSRLTKDGGSAAAVVEGPKKNQRAACATTDFAIQNVLLQMNLSLVSVDGMKLRKLKSWVTRCGACYEVYTASQESNGANRMFCSRCGSDALQRVAASVNGKTGRLKLHLSKKYKNNLRGTKFSLPKAGQGNRFQGDLLLREDQMMMGAWQQKVKKGAGKHTAQSMFGSDITGTVGCNAIDMTKRDDIKVGFGRRNPNATKFGRERRGKKKKSDDKACGLRRY
eukprot:scaffold15048_cov55-Attheya_sp.AAC.3